MAGFKSFEDFYKFYLEAHRHPLNRRLHLVGTTLALICVGLFVLTDNGWFLLIGPALGYTLAWIGHFRFERNKPATFSHPFYSLAADLRMLYEIVLSKLR